MLNIGLDLEEKGEESGGAVSPSHFDPATAGLSAGPSPLFGKRRGEKKEPEIPVIAGGMYPVEITVPVKIKKLNTHGTDLIKLADEKFCHKKAEEMFEWFQKNLPYGVYQQLYKLMEERQNFLNKP